MALVLHMLDGKVETLFYPDRDFTALVRKHMGDDAANYVESLVLENKQLFEEIKEND